MDKLSPASSKSPSSPAARAEFSASRLEIRDLCLWVRLGCGAEERANLQEIRVSISVEFQAPPPGCFSDSLEGTLCYAEAALMIRALVAPPAEFRLIEHMAYRIWTELKERWTHGDGKLSVRVHKVRPPVDGLSGGSEFVYSGY